MLIYLFTLARFAQQTMPSFCLSGIHLRNWLESCAELTGVVPGVDRKVSILSLWTKRMSLAWKHEHAYRGKATQRLCGKESKRNGFSSQKVGQEAACKTLTLVKLSIATGVYSDANSTCFLLFGVITAMRVIPSLQFHQLYSIVYNITLYPFYWHMQWSFPRSREVLPTTVQPWRHSDLETWVWKIFF